MGVLEAGVAGRLSTECDGLQRINHRMRERTLDAARAYLGDARNMWGRMVSCAHGGDEVSGDTDDVRMGRDSDADGMVDHPHGHEEGCVQIGEMKNAQGLAP